MKNGQLFILVAGAALAAGAAWWTVRRAQAAASCGGNCPPGFGWDKKRGQFTRVNASGELEVYAEGAFL